MRSLQEFLAKDNPDNLIEFYHITDIDKWLFESYDETLGVSESQFYHMKYNFYSMDSPQYWFWQEMLYERLDTSVTIDSSVFGKLFKNIPGIIEVIVDNEYAVGFRYNYEFSFGSLEFERLLNFGNYFIKSKRDENGKYPNPFFIEARRPKELQEYRFKKALHVTNKYAWEKIQKTGLIPKSKSNIADYEYRVYLFTDDNIKPIDLKLYGSMFLKLWKMSIAGNDKHDFKDKIDVDKDIVILEIDLEQFETDHEKQLKLFGDPSYNKKSAMFTLEPIPTKYIKRINL